MTTNKPSVQRYDNMGCPEEICRVDTMYESDDGDYVVYEDYEALQAECEKLRKDAERLKARVAELEEGIARCRQQASYCIGNEEALKNQLSKVRDIANEVLISKGGDQQ